MKHFVLVEPSLTLLNCAPPVACCPPWGLRVGPAADEVLCCPQKIFGAEVRPVPSGHFGFGDGDARPGPGLSPKLLHLHHLWQDADHWGPLWDEGQPGVLPPAL